MTGGEPADHAAGGAGPDGPASGGGVVPLDAAGVAALTQATAAGDVVLFPAEGVYGLAAGPEHADAVGRIARLKGRDPAKPSSVLFWSIEAAATAVDGAGERVLRAMTLLLPGPIGVVVPNPAGRYPLATGTDRSALGVRVPALAGGPVDAPPVLQTSANRAGEADPATVDAVPRGIRRACALILDRGARPGVPSTVVDLRGLAGTGGGWRLLRHGAVRAEDVAAALEDVGPRAA